MKKVAAFLLVLCLICVSAFAAAAHDADKTAEYLAHSAKKNSVEEHAASLGYGEEWSVFALARFGCGFTSYESSFDASVEHIINPVERERCALALVICGAEKDKIASLVKGAVGGQGIMSLVFGLHVIANGVEYPDRTTQDIIDNILSLQLPDGGFALFGTVSDVDVSAMTLQALAEFADARGVAGAMEKTVAFLSSAQKDDGGYVSFGTESSESVSMVIIALSSLGIDCETDERFIKNGNTLFCVLDRYLLGDGSYEHTKGGGANRLATVQALCAVESYKYKGHPFWIFSETEPREEISVPVSETEETSEETSEVSEEITETSLETSETPEGSGEISGQEASEPGSSAPAQTVSDDVRSGAADESGESSASEEENGGGANVKLIILCALGALAGAALCVLIIKRKANVINVIIVLAVFAAAAAVVLAADIYSAQDYYGKTESKANVAGKAYISVNAEGVAGKGFIIEKTELEFGSGGTVYDLLIDAARLNGVALDVTGAGAFVYVRGIDYLYEREHGDLSGWVYTVNGVSASVGCAAYELEDGDVVEWFYTTDGIDRTKQ